MAPNSDQPTQLEEAKLEQVRSRAEWDRAKAKRVEVQTYPTGVWPKLTVSIAIALLGGGSASIGVADARSLVGGWADALIPLVAIGVSFWVLALVLLYVSLGAIRDEDNARLLRYKNRFDPAPAASALAAERVLEPRSPAATPLDDADKVRLRERISRLEGQLASLEAGQLSVRTGGRPSRLDEAVSRRRRAQFQVLLAYAATALTASVFFLEFSGTRDFEAALAAAGVVGSGVLTAYLIVVARGEEQVRSAALRGALDEAELEELRKRLREE